MARGQMGKTTSERIFEEYLHDRGTGFDFEKGHVGKSRRPDYTIAHRRSKVLCEVKEFPIPEFIGREVGTFDPFPRVREKINVAAKQFREFKDYVCCLVLCNLGDALVPLDDAMTIWGAMLGNPAVSVPIDTGDSTNPPEPERMVFAEKGKMLRYKDGRPSEPQNTTISAILVLEHLWVGQRRFHAHYRSPDNTLTTIQQAAICWDRLQAAQGTRCDAGIRHLRVVVYENPYARRRPPRTLFRGPFDERHAANTEGRIERVFAGRELLALEDEEARAGTKSGEPEHLKRLKGQRTLG